MRQAGRARTQCRIELPAQIASEREAAVRGWRTCQERLHTLDERVLMLRGLSPDEVNKPSAGKNGRRRPRRSDPNRDQPHANGLYCLHRYQKFRYARPLLPNRVAGIRPHIEELNRKHRG